MEAMFVLPSQRRLQLQLTSKQDPGCAQFESLNRDKLIRFQRNRCAFHWKSIALGESALYPSYHTNIQSFGDEFALRTYPPRRRRSNGNRTARLQRDVQLLAQLASLRKSVKRGCPYGEESWSAKSVARLGLESTLRPHGRPQNHKKGS